MFFNTQIYIWLTILNSILMDMHDKKWNAHLWVIVNSK